MTEVIKYSLTCSAADTGTEFEKSLEQEIGQKRRGKRGQSTKVMWVKAITIEWEALTTPPVAADNYWLQITTNSEQNNEVNISDKDCFFKAKFQVTGITTEIQDIIKRYLVDLPYIKKTMYITIGSAGHGAACNFHVQLEFEYRYVNDWVLSRMISRKA
jgi:hypothetical protein